jgi:hypothetical protein
MPSRVAYTHVRRRSLGTVQKALDKFFYLETVLTQSSSPNQELSSTRTSIQRMPEPKHGLHSPLLQGGRATPIPEQRKGVRAAMRTVMNGRRSSRGGGRRSSRSGQARARGGCWCDCALPLELASRSALPLAPVTTVASTRRLGSTGMEEGLGGGAPVRWAGWRGRVVVTT